VIMEATIELTTTTKSKYFTKNSRAPSYELQEIICFSFIIAYYTNCFLINTIFQSIIKSTTKKTLVDELSAKNRKSYNVKLMKTNYYQIISNKGNDYKLQSFFIEKNMLLVTIYLDLVYLLCNYFTF